MRPHNFQEYDHVIWDTDTYPSVCILGHDKGDGFIDIMEGEYISDHQLKVARKATGKEIHEFYKNNGAVI